MAENSKIEWTDHTVNLWWGCTKVHDGCDNCYAEALSHRYGDNVWGNDVPRKEIKSAFNNLDKYQRQGEKSGKMIRVFVGSMMDIFEKPMPLIGKSYDTGGLRSALFDRIIRGDYKNILFLLLTKRPSNINKYIPNEWRLNGAPDNVWFGTSPVDCDTFNTLVPQLRKVDGNRFLSIEPQLHIMQYADLDGIGWVIQGGESGNKRRPFDIAWGERMKEICKEQSVPFFFKQIDKVLPIPEQLMIKESPASFKLQ